MIKQNLATSLYKRVCTILYTLFDTSVWEQLAQRARATVTLALTAARCTPATASLKIARMENGFSKFHTLFKEM